MRNNDKNIQTILTTLLKYRDRLLESEPRVRGIPYVVTEDSGLLFAARCLAKEEQFINNTATTTAKADVRYLSNISLAKSDRGGIDYKVSIAKKKAGEAATVYDNNMAEITAATQQYEKSLSDFQELLTELQKQSTEGDKQDELLSLEQKIEEMRKEQLETQEQIEKAECERNKYKTNLDAVKVVLVDLEKGGESLYEEFERVSRIVTNQKKQKSDSEQPETQAQVSEVKKNPQRIQLSDLKTAEDKLREKRDELDRVSKQLTVLSSRLQGKESMLDIVSRRVRKLSDHLFSLPEDMRRLKESLKKEQEETQIRIAQLLLDFKQKNMSEYSSQLNKKWNPKKLRLKREVEDLTQKEEELKRKVPDLKQEVKELQRMVQKLKTSSMRIKSWKNKARELLASIPRKPIQSEDQEWAVPLPVVTRETVPNKKQQHPPPIRDIAPPDPTSKVTEKAVNDARETLEEKDSEIREASQQIGNTNQKITSNDRNIKELKEKQKERETTLASLEKKINHLSDWLGKNLIPPLPENITKRSDPECLNSLIGRYTELLDRQKAAGFTEVVDQARRKFIGGDCTEAIKFDGTKLQEVIDTLKAIQGAMTQAREYQPLNISYKRDRDSTGASLDKLQRKQQKVKWTINDNIRRLEESLRSRKMQMKGLIPGNNQFANTLGKFDCVLQEMKQILAHKKKPKPTTTNRVNQIKKEYDACKQEYDATFLLINNLYTFSWYATKTYYGEMAAAREGLTKKLEILIDPGSNENKPLKKSSSMRSKLLELKKLLFRELVSCAGIGSMYRLYSKHVVEQSTEEDINSFYLIPS